MFHNLQNAPEDSRGIVLYIRESLKASLCDDFTSDFSENVIVECTQADGEKLLIRLIYRRSKGTKENTAHLNKLVKEFSERRTKNKLLMGDFNFPKINWNTESCNASEQHPATQFLTAIKDAYLVQNQKTPTRFRQGKKMLLIWFLQTPKT